MELHVACNLKVILLLTDKRVVRIRKIEALVSVYTKMGDWSEDEKNVRN
jgi:hypothetical protein